MKEYTINGIKTSKNYFDKELRRCFTRSEHLYAGATNGIVDGRRLAEVRKQLNKGWSYRCKYAPAGLDLEFKIIEVQNNEI